MANAVYVAECFWAGVQEHDLRALDLRIASAMSELGARVRYVGRLHVLDDEVVLVVLEGPIGNVRGVAEHAGVPFERLLRVAYAPWPNGIADEEAPE